MEWFAGVIIGLQIMGWSVGIAILIYLILRRNRIKKEENFENRSN